MVFGFTMLKSSVLFTALLAAILVEAIDVSREKVPYVVSIKEADEHICSGTILRGNWVLTSPQFVYDKQPKDLLVVTGTVDKTDSKALSVHVKKIEVHPNYDYMNFAYSLALLKTKEDISYSKLVMPIDLPTAPTKIADNLFALGWKLKGNLLLQSTVPTSNWRITKDISNDTLEHAEGKVNEALVDRGEGGRMISLMSRTNSS
ncbi:trypsin-4-like [Pieris rapae]|uniref:trypsin-4-like n=1 Tax=Pieris rapae TaxID=64459 RepID=UPI001E27A7D0|nr:trypsin-4-like [Pieris rapae]